MSVNETDFRLRRRLLRFIIATPLALACPPWLRGAAGAEGEGPTPQAQLAALETASAGRLGVAAVNIADGATVLHRADERFPLCSTFKVLLAAAVLERGMGDSALLEQRVAYSQADLLSWAPVTRKQVEQGMTVAQLCAAALQYSDNTAANLLMKLLGGPSVVTAFARAMGDNEFRLDRWEPELNTAIPDDPRDTSTPAAMARSLQLLTLGTVLAPPQRERLRRWLDGNTTGAAKIRAGVPGDWLVGDKTGSGDYGATNDLALLRPPGRSPIIVAAYFTQQDKDAPSRNDVLASVGRIVARTFCQGAA